MNEWANEWIAGIYYIEILYLKALGNDRVYSFSSNATKEKQSE